MASVLQFSTHSQCAPVQHTWPVCSSSFSACIQHTWPVCSSSACIQHTWPVCSSSACIQHTWPVCSSSACIQHMHMASVLQFSMYSAHAHGQCAREQFSMILYSAHMASVLQFIFSMYVFSTHGQCAPVQHTWPVCPIPVQHAYIAVGYVLLWKYNLLCPWSSTNCPTCMK